MKVIDLLNKIANGEEVPKKIRYDSNTYYYIEDNREGVCYINTALDKENIWSYFLYNIDTLNDEVEIIEEDKKIEKLKLNYYQHSDVAYQFGNKINEIIDKVNKGE